MMRRIVLSVVLVLGLAAGLALPSCDTPLFYCAAEPDLADGGPLCWCHADDLLCDHPGFGSCWDCPAP